MHEFNYAEHYVPTTFCPPFCRKKKLVHKLCLLLPRLSIGQLCEAGISLRLKKMLQHLKEFFIILKIPVSKNATNLIKSPSFDASFQIIFVKLFF